MRVDSGHQPHDIARLQRLQQARLSPASVLEPQQGLQQIRFYNDALAHIERLKQVSELTPQQLGKLFLDSEFEARLASATAPNLLDNPAAEATREGLAGAFREARRERARAAHSPHQEVSGGLHTVQLPDRTIRFRPEDSHWVQVERDGDSLHWSQDQVERRHGQGFERFTLAGDEPVRQTRTERVRARPDGSSLFNGQHLGAGYAMPPELDSPRLRAPWWRTQEPGQEVHRDGLRALPERHLEGLSPEQQFAPLAELQSQMAHDHGKVGLLALEQRFHQRAEATLNQHANSSLGGEDFGKLFKGERPPGWQFFGSLDDMLKGLKMSPDSADGKSLKEAAQKLEPHLPAMDMLVSLFEVVKRIGVRKAVTILNKMNEFAAEAKKSGRDPQQLYQFLSALLTDVARPSEVNQQQSPTCGTAAIQVHLVGQDPVKYVEMMTTLAGGKNYKAGDLTFKPPGDWSQRPQDGRNLTAWIFQESLSNERRDFKGKSGTSDRDEARFTQALLGEFWNPIAITNTGDGTKEMLEQIEDDVSRGRSVSIGVTTGKDKDGKQTYHAVLVVGIDKTSKPMRYEIISWGQRGWLTKEQLSSCLTSVLAADDWGFDENQVKDGTKKETIPAA
ncbi:MAG: hypothetical protein KF760_29765 [Candidatus Eremiobacteraeota bacterium]|nr:hypothetical protein [Candidatus Eremiobacteraeota bacterium]MCW5870590.1 hypothetical protein [Candidatus Eremiobacteraeota bacterium]